MLNRKPSKFVNGADTHGRNGQRNASDQERRPRRRFIISSKAAARADTKAHPVYNELSKTPPALVAKTGLSSAIKAPGTAGPAAPADLAETIKTLLHLAHENGHITYDD